MLNQIIGIFIPSIIGNRKYISIFGNTDNKINYVERYLIIALFTNMIAYAISIWVFNEPGFEFTNQFTVKYVILSVIISYMLPVIYEFIKSNFNLNIVVKKNEK